MAHTPRIAIQLDHSDPFWVLLGEAIRQQSQSRSAEIVELIVHKSHLLSIDEQIEVVENLAAQELDALICNTYPRELLARILDSGLPIVVVSETSLRHERLISRTGLYDAGLLLGAFLGGQLADGAQVVVVGGQGGGEDTGQSRVDGFVAGLSAHPPVTLRPIACTWSPEDARRRVEEYLLTHPGQQIDAIFGLSDSLALATQATCRAHGRLRDGAHVVGINGDPLALAAIAAGQMAATVETDVDDMAAQALDLAIRAARGETLPALFACRQRLIRADTVAEAATRKLINLAALPTRLAEVRQLLERRTLQAELSAAIDPSASLPLGEPQRIQALTRLIRDRYGFDLARFLRVHEGFEQRPCIYLPLPPPEGAGRTKGVPARRVLLLVSQGTTLPTPVVQLAERRGLTLHALRPGDNLAGALKTMRPALLACDVAAADDGWRIIEELRSVPELRRLPVMIYGGAADASIETVGAATGVLLKPVGGEALLEALSDLDPSTPEGSILIVEGDPHARAQHRRLIAQHLPGYSIRDAGDGRAALEAVAARLPSLIVLDLVLPEFDGFAVLEVLRATRRTAGVPVLVLSEKALTSDDIPRLIQARVVFQTRGMLTGEEFAETLRRALSPNEGLSQHTSGLVKQALAFIQQHHGQPLSRQAIADAVGVHKDYLGRIFQQEVGLSPWEYLIRYRVLRARELLRTTELTVAEVAAKVGFETPTYFSLVFNRQVGVSPRTYRVRHHS